MSYPATPAFDNSNLVCLGLYGIDVTYAPSASPAFTIKGIFSRVDPIDPRPESPYCNLWVRTLDLPTAAAGMPPIPSRGDSVDVGDGIARTVFEINLDNTGGCNLRLVGR